VLGGNPNSTYGAPFSGISRERQLSENKSTIDGRKEEANAASAVEAD